MAGGAIIPIADRALAAVQNDLIVIGGQVFRRVVLQKKKRKSKKFPKGQDEIVQLVPFDVQVHVNPLSIGLGAAGLAIAAFLGIGKIQVPNPLGDPVVLYEGPFKRVYDCWQLHRRYQAGDGTALRDALAMEPPCPWTNAITGSTPTCDEFRKRWCEAKARRGYTDMARAKRSAQAAGCTDVGSWTCP